MLPNAEVVELVAKKIKEFQIVNAVIDPVLVSTSGHSLADSEVAAAIREHLMPLATIVTPNIPEAEALLGESFTLQFIIFPQWASQLWLLLL